MSNPYLEKRASMYDYWNDLTGKEHNDLRARKAHLERAIANGDSVESLSHRIKDTGRKTFRARTRAAGGVLGLATLGVVGANAYTNHQQEVAARNMHQYFALQKQAGVASFLQKGLGVMKSVGAKALDVTNTAHGGKIKQFGVDTFGKHTPDFTKFVGGNRAAQSQMVQGGDLDKLKNLYSQQTKARVGVYGGAAGITLAYNQGKKQSQQQSLPQSYYY
jgi:hypothetical protein